MTESHDFVECYQRHYPRLVRALALAGAPPEVAADVAQDAFVVALTHWRRVSNGSNPPGYVYRVAFRSFYRRRTWQSREIPLDEPASEPQLPDDTATRIDVEQALAKLPPRRRAAAVLGLVLGFSGPQIAVALGIAPATARKHLEEARNDLRRWLVPP